MDFKDRFKGKTTIITKEGIDELIATQGIPIKNPFSQTFCRTSYIYSRPSSNIKARIDPSKSPEKDTITTRPIDPKSLARLKIRPYPRYKRDDSLSQSNNELSAQLPSREGDSVQDINITRQYKSFSSNEKRVLTTQPTDESCTSPELMEKPEKVGEVGSNIPTQTNDCPTQATEADHDREESPCIYKRVTFLDDNPETQEQENSRSQTAAQRIYRSILKSQEGGFRNRGNMELSVQRARSEEPKELKKQEQNLSLVRSQTHKEPAERPGSSSHRPINRSLSLINSYKVAYQNNENKVPKVNIDFIKFNSYINKPETFYSSSFMPKLVTKSKTERRQLSMSERSPEPAKLKAEKPKQQGKPVNPLGKLKFMNIKFAIIPKLKEKIILEKCKSISHRGELLSS